MDCSSQVSGEVQDGLTTLLNQHKGSSKDDYEVVGQSSKWTIQSQIVLVFLWIDGSWNAGHDRVMVKHASIVMRYAEQKGTFEDEAVLGRKPSTGQLGSRVKAQIGDGWIRSHQNWVVNLRSMSGRTPGTKARYIVGGTGDESRSGFS